jgi:FixJ family two-component response regulator
MSPQKAVVIVDDEPDVLESTAMVVESLGYKAIRVQDPSAILDTVSQEAPALLLQDLRMPGLTIAGLVASLRSQPSTATVPIVFFSANTDVAATAARYDAWGYLPKPFTAQELAHLLHKIAGTPTPESATPKDRQREVRAAFHDYWNLLAAFTNYLTVLERLPSMPPEALAAVKGLDQLLLKLESKTDRLRVQASLWAGPEPAEKPEMKELDEAPAKPHAKAA